MNDHVYYWVCASAVSVIPLIGYIHLDIVPLPPYYYYYFFTPLGETRDWSGGRDLLPLAPYSSYLYWIPGRGEKEESRREQRILWYIIIGEQERIKHFVNFWRSRDLSFLLWSYCDDKGSLQKNKIKKIYKFAFHVNQVYCADFKIIRQKNKIIISTILWVEASNGFRP